MNTKIYRPYMAKVGHSIYSFEAEGNENYWQGYSVNIKTTKGLDKCRFSRYIWQWWG